MDFVRMLSLGDLFLKHYQVLRKCTGTALPTQALVVVKIDENGKQNWTKYRIFEHGSEIVFSNNRYTTPVSFEFAPDKNSTYLNIFASLKKVFIVMKIADTSTKLIANDGTVLESPSAFNEGP